MTHTCKHCGWEGEDPIHGYVPESMGDELFCPSCEIQLMPEEPEPQDIVELLSVVGSDNIRVQNLDADADGCKVSGGVGRFTFRTDPQLVIERIGDEPSEHVGLILWIPRNLLPE